MQICDRLRDKILRSPSSGNISWLFMKLNLRFIPSTPTFFEHDNFDLLLLERGTQPWGENIWRLTLLFERFFQNISSLHFNEYFGVIYETMFRFWHSICAHTIIKSLHCPSSVHYTEYIVQYYHALCRAVVRKFWRIIPGTFHKIYE